jgi:hypothetical protein
MTYKEVPAEGVFICMDQGMEELRDSDPRMPFQKGNGEIRLQFDETDKQQKFDTAQIIMAVAKADGIETILDEGVSWLDNVTPEFIISFVDVPKDLMMKFGDLQIELQAEREIELQSQKNPR